MKDVDAVKYADFAAAVAQAIDEQNAAIAMRHTLDEKKKKEGDDDDTKRKKGKEKDKRKREG
jgi:hypothetical protein